MRGYIEEIFWMWSIFCHFFAWTKLHKKNLDGEQEVKSEKEVAKIGTQYNTIEQTVTKYSEK